VGGLVLRTGDEKHRVLKKRERFKRNRSMEEKFERERSEKQRDHNQREVFLDRKRFIGKLSLKLERERENKNRKRRRKKTRGITEENRGKTTTNCRLPP
jgi:hypothetical protein